MSNVEMGMGGKCKVKIENKGAEIETDGTAHPSIVRDGMTTEGMKTVGNTHYYTSNYVCMGTTSFFYSSPGPAVASFIIRYNELQVQEESSFSFIHSH